MDPITQQTVLAAAAAAGGGSIYVDDVFSTYLYDGNDANGRDIPNGIDLDGEGGMVWIKRRNGDHSHCLFDTERGVDSLLHSNTPDIADTSGGGITAFNSDGFTIDNTSSPHINDLNDTFASWSFRKAPGFFDVVTYNGDPNGNPQSISHNLGSVPGMVIVKQTTGSSESWYVYHRSTGNDKHLVLNNANPSSGSSAWNDTTPTSTHFTVNSDDVNENGQTYVAYLFAHDDAQFGTDEDESIIKCGTYTGNGSSTTPVEINLGFEPQFVLLRCTLRPGNHGGGWYLFYSTRGIHSGSTEPTVQSQELNAEASSNNANIALTPTGFNTDGDGVHCNASGGTYIYMAIRRPNKPLSAYDPPLAATDVFAIDTGNGSSTIPAFDSGFPVDFAFRLSAYASGGNNPRTHSRLQGSKELYIPLDIAEADDSGTVFDSMTGMSTGFNSNDIAWMFKRAPGFMDVVTYNGATGGAPQNIQHNLGVVPEFMIVKRRSGTEDWATYSASLGANKYTKLNKDNETYTNTTIWDNTTPTSSVFRVGGDGSVNQFGQTFIAYLFATLPGISKVGSYTSDGNAVDIDCGFTGGARFVLIKRTDSDGHWYLWDTTRGYNGTTDNFLRLNSSGAQDANIANIDDHLDALPAGFTVRASSGVNTSGANYIFLAIA